MAGDRGRYVGVEARVVAMDEPTFGHGVIKPLTALAPTFAADWPRARRGERVPDDLAGQ